MRFSVVTPSFKQLDWLELCAASIADQSVEVEHIVQDAGTPGIEQWATRHPGVTVHAEKDDGMYDAINRGLRRATGDICSYLNCDEQYLPGTLGRVSEFFNRHPEIDVLFGDAILTDPELRPLSYRRIILPSAWHLLLRPLGTLTAATFFRRKLVEEGALFDPAWRAIGDKKWVYELLRRGYRMGTLPEPLSIFALTGANLSNDEKTRAENQRWDAQAPCSLKLLKPAIVGWHLFTKWTHGAYVNRVTQGEWYTRTSYPKRQSFAGTPISWHWPVLTEIQAKS